MKKKVLFLSNHFITLYNFRKELIQTLVDEGHHVYLAMPKAEENTYFAKMGCTIIETAVDRRGINPITDGMLILRYIKVMKAVNPDIIFSYTIKPNIYGCMASNFTGHRQISNITGTGATFLTDTTVSKIAKVLYKVSVKKSYKVFFQNRGDKDFFVENDMIRDNYDMLPGSGVNLHQYELCDMPEGVAVNFIFIGRVMKVKGIDEYLACAKAVKEKYPETNFYIAGFIEEDSYKEVIEKYEAEGYVHYLGFQKDITSWISKCHCTILPSHGGEGVPNVLLESAAMGRICIASNINGSKDVIDEGKTGFLFEAGDPEDLMEKVIETIKIDNKAQMGKMARKKVQTCFDRKIIIDRYMDEIHKNNTIMGQLEEVDSTVQDDFMHEQGAFSTEQAEQVEVQQ